MPTPVVQLLPPKPVAAPEVQKSPTRSANREELREQPFDRALTKARKLDARQPRAERGAEVDAGKKPAKPAKTARKRASDAQPKDAANEKEAGGAEAVAGEKDQPSPDQQRPVDPTSVTDDSEAKRGDKESAEGTDTEQASSSDAQLAGAQRVASAGLVNTTIAKAADTPPTTAAAEQAKPAAAQTVAAKSNSGEVRPRTVTNDATATQTSVIEPAASDQSKSSDEQADGDEQQPPEPAERASLPRRNREPDAQAAASDAMPATVAVKPQRPAQRQTPSEPASAEATGANAVVDVAKDDPSIASEDDLSPSTVLTAADPIASLTQFAAQLHAPAAPVDASAHKSAAPAPPAPPPPEAQFASDNHPRILSGIHGQLLPNGGTMHLRLDPPELGALTVSVQMRDGVMTAAFETSNDDATRMLSHSLLQLKHVLESQGVSVEKLHVQQSPRDQQSSSDESRQQRNPFEDSPAHQEQQRREMLRRMWRKLTDGSDPLDMVA